ncbi:MAG: DUF6882 domain-containing protein [Myxococcota bacterium]
MMVKCGAHGERVATVVCRHLAEVDERSVGFVLNSDDPRDLQAWCAGCEARFEQEGGLTQAFRAYNGFRIVCTVCFHELWARHGPAPDVAPPADGDWGAWSREAATWLEARHGALFARHGLEPGPAYHWDLDEASIQLTRPDGLEVRFDIQCIGSTATGPGTFLWSWANPSLRSQSTQDVPRVRAFGEQHGLDRLTDASWPGAHADGLEMLAVAGRILGASGVWIETTDTGAVYLLLFEAPS